jgi:hypothetical protein
MKSLYSTLLFGGLALSFMACGSGELSRSKAKALLAPIAKFQEADPYSNVHFLLVKIGTVANCGDLPSGSDPVQPSAEYYALDQTGFIEVRPTSKKHVWNVELTELGKRNIIGEKWAHERKGDCDQWRVTFPLAKYDHFKITGISSDGIHARVELSAFYNITPVGIAVRKVGDAAVVRADPHTSGETSKEPVHPSVENLIGNSIANLPVNSDKYEVRETCQFKKYDDGWRVSRGQDILGTKAEDPFQIR